MAKESSEGLLLEKNDDEDEIPFPPEFPADAFAELRLLLDEKPLIFDQIGSLLIEAPVSGRCGLHARKRSCLGNGSMLSGKSLDLG